MVNKMRFTREDAKRLIKDLPNVYLEIPEKEYLKRYGILPTKSDIRPIRVREVLLAYVKGRNGLVIEFTDVNNPLIDTLIMSRGDTAILVGSLYKLIKRRKKLKALDEIYITVNETIDKILTVNYDDLISNIFILRSEFDSFFDAFSPINLTGCNIGQIHLMQATLEKISNKKLKLEMNTKYNDDKQAILMPTIVESEGVRNLFSMIYNDNHNYLIKGVYGARESDFYSLMKLRDKEQIRVLLKRLTWVQLIELNRVVNYSITVLAKASAKYKALGIKCREEIVPY